MINLVQLLLSTMLALGTALAFALDIFWLQILFVLYLAAVIRFSIIIGIGVYKYGSMTRFAYCVLEAQDDLVSISQKAALIRFLSYDVVFAGMLVYLNQPGFAAIYLTAHAVVHQYFATLGILSKENPN